MKFSKDEEVRSYIKNQFKTQQIKIIEIFEKIIAEKNDLISFVRSILETLNETNIVYLKDYAKSPVGRDPREMSKEELVLAIGFLNQRRVELIERILKYLQDLEV